MKKRNLHPHAAKPVTRITTGLKDDLLNEYPESAIDVNGEVAPSNVWSWLKDHALKGDFMW
ncbi:hypothetical protein Lepto7376_0892 [[Leptolyngbya] sp. PCC 7376]|uniref:DUF5837 family cyanobactin class RiPP n=1 Tax=[Leptolyngbya] sp. PCC 7376 TaxID=111781 RepID=UPI00029EECDC|nr:DUF5837 family cyanobactin class RiPP [[Leptolyngbya] sp. PCC 7376]AFY37272.1 hypothetical protein Lepto7376_0892 [[Leptolyngbya] sp. PCC 7376]